MKSNFYTLVFLVFTGLALPLSGCVIDNTNSCNVSTTINLTWSIDDNLGHGLLCSDVGASTVSVAAAGVISNFPCTAYAGFTFEEPVGSYTVDAQLLNGSGATLSDANAVWSIPCGGRDIDVAFCVGGACPP